MNPDDIQKKVAGDLGISDLSDEEQKKIIADFGGVALQASTVAVIEALPADKRDQFAQLLQAGDEEAVATFLGTNLPDHENVARQAVAAEIQRFKDFQKTV